MVPGKVADNQYIRLLKVSVAIVDQPVPVVFFQGNGSLEGANPLLLEVLNGRVTNLDLSNPSSHSVFGLPLLFIILAVVTVSV